MRITRPLAAVAAIALVASTLIAGSAASASGPTSNTPTFLPDTPEIGPGDRDLLDVGDINDDGLDDIATALSDGTLVIYVNQGTPPGSFTSVEISPIPGCTLIGLSIGEGLLGVLCQDTFELFDSTGVQLDSSPVAPAFFPPSRWTRAIAPTTLNDLPGFVIAGAMEGSGWLEAQTFGWDGIDLISAQVQMVNSPVPVRGSIVSLDVASVTGPVPSVAWRLSGAVFIAPVDGTAPAVAIAAPGNGFSIVAGDVDANGLDDLLVEGLDAGLPVTTVLFQQSDGTFTPVTGTSDVGTEILELRSFTSSCYADVSSTHAQGSATYFSSNTGNGWFVEVTQPILPIDYAAAVGDLNGDRRLDYIDHDGSSLFAGYQNALSPVFTTQPANVVAAYNGEEISFSVATNPAPESVQWQTAEPGSEVWTDILSATGTEYTFTATPDVAGNRYRALVTTPGDYQALSCPAALNDVLPGGGFEVTKTVTGTGDVTVGNTQFTVHYSYLEEGVTVEDDLSISGGTSDGLDGIAAGTVVTLSEPTMPDVPGVTFGTPVWSGDGVSPQPDGTAQLTITDGGMVEVGLQNTANLVSLTLTVSKTVLGTAASLVGNDAPFTVYYTVNGGETQTVTPAPTRATPATISGLPPTGTVVIWEDTFPDLTPAVTWGTPEFSLNSGAVVDGPLTVNLAESGLTPAVEVINYAEYTPVTVEFRKELGGEWEAGGVPLNAGFPIQFRLGGTGDWSTASISAAPNGGFGLSGLDPGTTVEVRELLDSRPALGTGYVWADPVLTAPGGGSVTGANILTFSLGVNTGEPQVARITNSVIPPSGFTIDKTVTGPQDAIDAAATVEFPIQYCIVATCTDTDWRAAPITPAEVFSSGNVPVGTVVTIREIPDVTQTDFIRWGTPTIFIDGVEGNTFVMGEELVEVEVRNAVELRVGSVTLTKEFVDMPAAAMGDADLTFTWTAPPMYTTPQTATVNALSGWTWVSPAILNTSIFTISEDLTVRDANTPAGYRWVGSPVFDPSSGVNQGQVTVTESDTPIPITATNTAEGVGKFTIDLDLTGDGLPLLPVGFRYLVTYEIGTNTPVTIQFDPDNLTTYTSPDLPVGTVISVTATDPMDGVTYRFGTQEVTGGGVSDPTNLQLELVLPNQQIDFVVINTVVPITGDFTITKELVGISFGQLVGTPPSFTLQVSAATDPVTTYTVTLTEALPTWTLPVPLLVTTEVTISESPPSDSLLPPGQYRWVGLPQLNDGGDPTNSPFIITIVEGTIDVFSVSEAQAIGKFTVDVVLEGDGAHLVPPSLQFRIEIKIGDEPWTPIPLTVGDPPWESPEIPVTTVVQVRQEQPADGPGYRFVPPSYTIGLSPPSSAPPATFTLGIPGAVVPVVITNVALIPPPLPVTGTYGMPLVVAGLSILLIGMLAVLVAIRTRRTTRADGP